MTKNGLKVKAKLQKARRCLIDKNLTKTGQNNFQNFKYFELDDIVPPIIAIFDELGLESEYNLHRTYASLTITDTETGESTCFSMGIPKIDYNKIIKSVIERHATNPKVSTNSTLKEVETISRNAIQESGKTQTYTRRYLYLQALDITESDGFDAEDLEKEQKPKPKKQPIQKKNIKNVKSNQNKIMGLDETRRYIADQLDDIRDFDTAKEILKDLKSRKLITQNTLNTITKDMQKVEDQ